MVSTRASSSRAGSAAPESPAATSGASPATPSSPTRSGKRSSSRPGRKSTSRPPTGRRSNGSSTSPAPVSRAPRVSSKKSAAAGWHHAPDAPTLFWLAVSLPLVIWDTIYVLGRPHTMENGWLHWPLWSPYKLYGEVDHVYGWKAFNARSGFTAAQGALNVIETAMYLAYWYVFFSRAVQVGSRKAVVGRCGAQAVLIGFSAAVMTLSKTVLYWLNEYYSGFDNIGHNDLMSLIFLWIIPNGAWLVGSTWMIYSLGGDIMQGLETASHVKKD